MVSKAKVNSTHMKSWIVYSAATFKTMQESQENTVPQGNIRNNSGIFVSPRMGCVDVYRTLVRVQLLRCPCYALKSRSGLSFRLTYESRGQLAVAIVKSSSSVQLFFFFPSVNFFSSDSLKSICRSATRLGIRPVLYGASRADKLSLISSDDSPPLSHFAPASFCPCSFSGCTRMERTIQIAETCKECDVYRQENTRIPSASGSFLYGPHKMWSSSGRGLHCR